MNTEKHYSPALNTCLQSYVRQADWQGLVSYLHTLSNAQFRTAGYMLGEQIMASLSEPVAWNLAMKLVEDNAKAFLVTVLKVIAERIGKGELHLHSTGARAFLAQTKENVIDRKKVAVQLLPVLESPENIRWLMRYLNFEEDKDHLALLLRVPTRAASYALFCTLRYVEHDRSLLVRTTTFLIQRGDAMGFNLASLIRTYYGLDEVKGTFSLHVQPYQLARIESSYDAFCEIMKF